MRGLGTTQDFFLHLSHALKATLDRQVAPCDHDPGRTCGHRGQHQFRQVFKTLQCFNFQHQPHVVAFQPVQVRAQQRHISRLLHKRQTHHVGHLNNGLQVGHVFFGQRRQIQLAVRQIDAFVCHQLFAAVTRLGDFHLDTLPGDPTNHAANAAIIEPDAFTHLHLLNHLRQGARHLKCFRQGVTICVIVVDQVVEPVTGQMQLVTNFQVQSALLVLNVTHQAGVLFLVIWVHQVQHGFWREVASAQTIRDGPLWPALGHQQMALGTACVGEFNAGAHLEPPQPVFPHPNAGIHVFHLALSAHRLQTQARRAVDKPEHVFAWPELEHRRAWCDVAGANFRASQIHENLDVTPRCLGRLAHVMSHLHPVVRAVVCAIDAGDVHAGRHQITHHAGITGCLARQRDHDAHAPAFGQITQQCTGVLRQQGTAADTPQRLLQRAVLPGLSGQSVQQAQHLVKIGQHMRLGTPERRQTQPCQLLLHRAQIDRAKA